MILSWTHAFSEMGLPLTDTLATALLTLSPSQEPMDKRLKEISKKNEIRPWRIILTIFREISHSTPRGALFCKTVVQTFFLINKNRQSSRSRFRGSNWEFRQPRPNYWWLKWQNQKQNSYKPRKQSHQNFLSFLQTNFLLFQLRIKISRILFLKTKTHSFRV